MQETHNQNIKLGKLSKYNIWQIYFGTVLLTLYCYSTIWRFKLYFRVTLIFCKICFGVIIRNITFTKASCPNVINSGEKKFCSCHFEKFVSHFFSDRIKKLVAYFGHLSISREEMRSKFMRRKFSFLYVNIYFDVQNI